MAFDLIGCMKLSGGKHRPLWDDPCTDEDLIGCMELFDGKYRPRLNGGMGFCTDDKVGCMELSDGKHRPVLTYSEYDSAEELYNDCCEPCEDCGSCWDACERPRFITASFSGINWCTSEPTCGLGFPSPSINTQFTLEVVEPEIGDTCRWLYQDTGGGGSGLWVVIIVTVRGSPYFDMLWYCFYGYCTANPPNISQANLFSRSAYFLCGPPISNSLASSFTVGGCSGAPKAYGGNVAVDWSP